MALDFIKTALVDDTPYYLSMTHIISRTHHLIEYDIDNFRFRIILARAIWGIYHFLSLSLILLRYAI